MKTIFKIISVISLCILFFSNVPFVHAQTKIDTVSGYYIKLRLETTSDWTKFTFDSLSSTYYLTSDTIMGPLEYYYNYFGVSRSDSVYTAVEYQLFYPVLPANGITLTCTKGYWGITTITASVHCSLYDTSLSFQNTIVPGDPLNTKVINFPFSFIQCAKEENLLLPYQTACPQILAFYYPWYGSPSGPTGYWVHWDPEEPDYNAPDTPALGYYDSYDYSTITQHILWAKQAGIDGFICSWWGFDDFTDGAIQRVFQIADTSNFSISLYYEPGDIETLPDSARVQRCINDITYLVNTYGGLPSMLHYDGKPVLFIYTQPLAFLKLSQWQQVVTAIDQLNCVIIVDRFAPGILPLFDGWHQYNPVFLSYDDLFRINSITARRANLAGKIFAATASPGFINVPRQNGNKYNEQLIASLAYMPHYILITSFNEWGEATEIEPSLVYGYDYLNYTDVFRNYLDSLCSAVNIINESHAPEELNISVYPNPTKKDFTVTFPPDTREIQLLNSTGKIIQRIIVYRKKYYNFTIGNSGFYFVQIITDKLTVTKKIIVIK